MEGKNFDKIIELFLVITDDGQKDKRHKNENLIFKKGFVDIFEVVIVIVPVAFQF